MAVKVQIRTVLYMGNEIRYELERKSVKNVNLRIRCDGSIYVSASSRVPISFIDSFVLSNGEKILAAAASVKAKNDVGYGKESRSIKNGDTVMISGKAVKIEVRESLNNGAFFEDGKLIIGLCDVSDIEMCRKTFEKYMLCYSKEFFAEALERVYPLFSFYDIPRPYIKIRSMKTRWGSCIPTKGIVTLNVRLAEYPPHIADYVLIHELCHFMECNHSSRFYAHMDKIIPEWRNIKKELNELGRG